MAQCVHSSPQVRARSTFVTRLLSKLLTGRIGYSAFSLPEFPMRLLPILLVLLATPAGAWVPTTTDDGDSFKWNTCELDFFINEAGSIDLATSQVEDGASRALAEWARPSCTGLTVSYAGQASDEVQFMRSSSNNKNMIVFRDASGSWPVDRSKKIIALTTVTFCSEAGGGCAFPGMILDADIEMNGVSFTFTHTDEPGESRFDLGNTLTHEFGHLLGFDHSRDATSTMHDSAPVGETSKRELADDDVEAVCFTYPADSECEVQLPRAEKSGCDSVVGARSGSAPLPVLGLGLLAFAFGLKRRA